MLHWHALHVRSNTERLVETRLADFETFYPAREVKTTIGKNTRVVKRSWFPGYLFARSDWQDPRDRIALLSIPYLVSILGSQGTPAIVSDQEIDALRILERSVLAVTPYPYLKAGDRVRVVRGPLSGAEGYLVRMKGGPRLVISVDLLGRSVSTEIDQESIEPLAPARLAA